MIHYILESTVWKTGRDGHSYQVIPTNKGKKVPTKKITYEPFFAAKLDPHLVRSSKFSCGSNEPKMSILGYFSVTEKKTDNHSSHFGVKSLKNGTWWTQLLSNSDQQRQVAPKEKGSIWTIFDSKLDPNLAYTWDFLNILALWTASKLAF